MPAGLRQMDLLVTAGWPRLCVPGGIYKELEVKTKKLRSHKILFYFENNPSLANRAGDGMGTQMAFRLVRQIDYNISTIMINMLSCIYQRLTPVVGR